MDLLDR